MKNNLILFITGFSAAGKTTLSKYLEEHYPDKFKEVVSHTTRSPREEEKHGVHYYFVTPEEFDRMYEAGEFIEFVNLYGNKYGVSYKEVDRILNEGKIPVIVIHPFSMDHFDSLCDKYACLKIFLEPPSMEELYERLRKRYKNNIKELYKRMEEYKIERKMVKKSDFDYVIITDNIENTVCKTLQAIDRKLKEILKDKEK